MNKNKLSLVIALVVTVAVLAGGWFLGVQPQLALAAANGTQQETIDSTNRANQSELARLAKAAESLSATKSELATLRASVPASMDTTPFLKALDGSASAAGVVVTSITIGDATPYEAPAAAPSDAASPSATPSPTSSPSATPAVPSAPGPLTDAAITGTDFTVIPITVAVTGSYDQALAFTKSVQNGDRLFLVNRIAATDVDESGPPMMSQAWSLSGAVYVLGGTSDDASK
jgi:Tfp pilus assembly protein PilO